MGDRLTISLDEAIQHSMSELGRALTEHLAKRDRLRRMRAAYGRRRR